MLPTHQVYSRLPSVDWGFFVKNAKWTELGLLVLLAGTVIAFIVFLEKGGDARAGLCAGSRSSGNATERVTT